MSNDLFHLFPRATDYRKAPADLQEVVREPDGPLLISPFSERHLHCTWFDPRYRPKDLKTNTGERVHIAHPGSWNLEAGPDFIGAIAHVGREKRRIVGDAEIHIRPNDWKHHGHTDDPNYCNVKLHITYYEGTLSEEHLPPGTIQIALQPRLATSPEFSFEQIDLTAYPYEIAGPLSPLREKMSDWTPEDKQHFLDIAGEERLRRKTLMLKELISRHGAAQVLYAELMAALGYKHNKVPFRKLAHQLPIHELRQAADGNPDMAYALLLGVSGLMPEPEQIDGLADKETRSLVRHAWDIWWKQAEKWEERTMQSDQWSTAHVRPANHPLRRMMAAAHLFTLDQQLPDLLEEVDTGQAKNWISTTLKILDVNTQTYWTRRLSLAQPPQNRPIALIGRARAINILTNVLIPFVAATNQQGIFKNGILDALPCETVNSIITQTAHAIFGPDHSTKLYRTGLRRQGLIQVFYDYGIDGRHKPTP